MNGQLVHPDPQQDPLETKKSAGRGFNDILPFYHALFQVVYGIAILAYMSAARQNSQDTNQEKILAEYEKQGNEIIRKMIGVLTRAHKKVDNARYRKTASSLKGTT